MIVYYNGEYLPKGQLSISPDDRGFLFGDGVYEVIRSYNGKLFQLEAHFDRLKHSLAALRINYPNVHRLTQVTEMLIKKNELLKNSATIYIQISRGAPVQRTHRFPPSEIKPTIYAYASIFWPKTTELEKGVNVNVMNDIRWARCDIKSIALLPNVLGSQEAKENDAAETIFVRDGYVTEGSHTNIFLIKNNSLQTYPRCHYILSGVTRQIILELADKVGLTPLEYPFSIAELKNADEVFLTGTTTEVTPVTRISGKPIQLCKPGSKTIELQTLLKTLTG
ncbi:aminotransferase class IV [candidate division KSB1 bacterium]|nr:aminotransferase class IV [candidate division KSB1 bacterium]